LPAVLLPGHEKRPHEGIDRPVLPVAYTAVHAAGAFSEPFSHRSFYERPSVGGIVPIDPVILLLVFSGFSDTKMAKFFVRDLATRIEMAIDA